tara:strand:+ start:2260 stop:2880 length:621 start_codon:yes stop_codon:yes gene_type:complete
MAIPSKQIGWSNESNLLYELIRQMDKLQCEMCNVVRGPEGPVGPQGPAGTIADNYYGSFISIIDQTSTAGVAKAMEYEVTDLSNGVSIVNNLLAKPTRITFANTGVYNVQFSAQLHNTDGGGSSVHTDIWLAVDGSPVANSATKVSVTPNTPYVVAAWNFFINATAGQYAELIWQPSITGLIIEQEPAAGGVPAIPSVILTANRIG